MESGVIAVAADGSVTLFNAAAEEMTQLRADELRGKSVSELPNLFLKLFEMRLRGARRRLRSRCRFRMAPGTPFRSYRPPQRCVIDLALSSVSYGL